MALTLCNSFRILLYSQSSKTQDTVLDFGLPTMPFGLFRHPEKYENAQPFQKKSLEGVPCNNRFRPSSLYHSDNTNLVAPCSQACQHPWKPFNILQYNPNYSWYREPCAILALIGVPVAKQNKVSDLHRTAP